MMKPHSSRVAVWFTAVCVSTIFVGCSTTETRISEHPEIYNRLGQTDQALVSRGQIRNGMPQEAVYLAWGNAEQRATANVHGRPAETWIYLDTTADIQPFPHYGLGYGLGYGIGGGFYGGGYGGYRGGRSFSHGGRRFYGFGYDSFYDPFYYNRPQIVSYPSRTVSFQNGRVVAFQFLYPPRIF